METVRYPKYENSPAETMVESFVSTPSSFHNPPLFDNNLNPVDGFSPQSFDRDYNFNGSLSGLNLPEKKPIKKRKSWGQQLPEPKTNLPPRKRAKTEDEKEQRRVERVLRNRRAAQSSRERKRQEVEALEVEKRAIERKNMDLEMRLADMEAKYYLLQQELKRASGYNKTNFLSYSDSSTPDISEDSQLSPLTFSKQLFNAQDELCRPISPQSIGPLTSRTVDPSTLSPKSLSSPDSSNSNSSDMTQHPAVVLCDLQCQSEPGQPWMNSTYLSSRTKALKLSVAYLITMLTTFLIVLGNLNQNIMFLMTRFLLTPTYFIQRMKIFGDRTTVFSMNLSYVIFSTMKLYQTRVCIRISLLGRRQACSRNLARSLMNATMAALRFESKQRLFRNFLSTVALQISRRSSHFFMVLKILEDTKLNERNEKRWFQF
ncbi:Transcriptional activator hac1 [Golovinomyces cichoracearum]|uniref:Transcriptional activator hac1 n=1 Tax=Golovinomyces cichoracearum TaxID=62708 RepID=A0A420HHM9_9PEZI|nr:Transcriptional activator hac1 [Golovinomyces cichoracearum]